jgi:hypothetical protein
MTEVTENPQAETEAPKAPARESLPPMAGQILNLVEGRFTRITEIAAEQDKVGDVGKLLSEAIAESKNKQVVELRKKVEEANEFILKATKSMEEVVKPTLNVPSDEELAKMDEEYKTLASEINTYNGVFSMETRNVKDGLTVFDYFGQLPGKKRGAKSGQGTGTSRPRVSTIEFTQDVKGEQGWKHAQKDGKATFSILAAALKADSDNEVDVNAGDLHKDWTGQNGNKDWSDLPDVTTFIFTARPA